MVFIPKEIINLCGNYLGRRFYEFLLWKNRHTYFMNFQNAIPLENAENIDLAHISQKNAPFKTPECYTQRG